MRLTTVNWVLWPVIAFQTLRHAPGSSPEIQARVIENWFARTKRAPTNPQEVFVYVYEG